ncbi:NAD(P)-binding protein [Lepidopterella palustris CBS 459.81]|uniref:NAD(P)-binding protein n=1 Tax=Lepidopterella palustris CBS 459.81 TaxID=1314670 RepID=A0A8E2JBV9_9PEZI|nr:NAD(P)-binding protein [Lepidopterella palustris CBS 459.81]
MNLGKTVFLIGPGFIGWNVLELLVNEGYTVSALVRRKEHAMSIHKSGALTIEGSLDDHDLIAEHSVKNDIVFHTATADHLPSVQAVLDGIKQRARDGKSTIFIHTSGTGVLDDHALGEFKGEKVYSDDKPEDIDALPDDAPHRPIDLAIVNAAKELGEKAKLAIMIPPTIYGFNPKHNRLSSQIPFITRFALKHGYAGHVGKGLSVESQIHVCDLARAYIFVLHYMECTSPQELLVNPYFFCENGKEFSWQEVAEQVGKALHAKGLIKDPRPVSFPEAEWDDLYGDITGAVIGLNSRSRAVRLRQLGWTPREKGMWESFEQDELPAILAEAR